MCAFAQKQMRHQAQMRPQRESEPHRSFTTSYTSGGIPYAPCSVQAMRAPARRIVPDAITIPTGRAMLTADLALPEGAAGLVLFAHGSGSSRLSPRNRMVADVLNRGAIGTLLADLLTAEEDEIDRTSGQYRFDIDVLASRVIAVTDWIGEQPRLKNLGLGYFGASTGAAAALGAAASRPSQVRAVVSRGGRPDLAGSALSEVIAPCLFIVGGDDSFVLRLNREAIRQLPHDTQHHLEIIPGATHLFEEPGALDTVAQMARNWFQRYLPDASGRTHDAGAGRQEATKQHDACTANRIP